MLLGTRVQQEPVPAAWSARIGDYDIINSDEQLSAISDLKLVQDGGHLYLQFTDSTADGEPQRLLLRPRSDQEAQVLQLLPDAGPMISAIPTSAGEALAFGGYRAIRRTH